MTFSFQRFAKYKKVHWDNLWCKFISSRPWFTVSGNENVITSRIKHYCECIINWCHHNLALFYTEEKDITVSPNMVL